jgi:PAS domain S-box-containing protein
MPGLPLFSPLLAVAAVPATTAVIAAVAIITVVVAVLTGLLSRLGLRVQTEAATRERQLRQRAESARGQLTTILNSLPDACSAFDLAWRWTYVNPAAAELLRRIGKDPAAVIGRVLWDEIPALRGTTFEQEAHRAVAEHRIVEYREHAPALESWFENRIVPLATGTVTYTRDVTERVRAQEALRTANERIRLAVESADVGLWDFDPVTGVLTWSDRCKAAFGLPAGAPVTYDIFLERLHPEDRERTNAAVHAALDPRGTGEYRSEYRSVWPDGTTRWIDARGRAFFDDVGPLRRPVRFIGTVLDITRRMEAEEALRDEARLVEMLHRIGTTVAAELDTQKLVQLVTDEATALTGARLGAFFYETAGADGAWLGLYALSGISREHVARLPMSRTVSTLTDLFHGERTIRVDDITHDAEAGRLISNQATLLGPMPIRSYLAVPVVSRTGTPIGGLVFGHPDPGVFTEQHERIAAGIASWAAVAMDNARLYENERNARAEAQAASRVKSDFLTTMSHELRTPLNAIAGYAELLALGIRGPVTDAQREDLARIQRSQRHLLSLINDVLNFAKIESGHVDFDTRDVALSEIVGTIEVLVAPQLRARGLRYACEACDSAARVHADPDKVQQILLNLLSNAIKFTEPGGAITVSVELEDAAAAIHVRDTGCGVPPDEIEEIFEPFVQLHRGLTTAHEGTGLGLAISRDLARAMAGDITAESTPGQGSTFTLTLPRATGKSS